MGTRVYVIVVEEKKVLKWRTNRGNKQLVIFTLVYGRNSRTNNSFSLRKAIIFKRNLKIWDYAITGLGLFLHEHKMSKTFFLCHVIKVKEKEKISGDHCLYAIWWAKIFIKLPDDACIRNLILDPVPHVYLVEDRDMKTSLLTSLLPSR